MWWSVFQRGSLVRRILHCIRQGCLCLFWQNNHQFLATIWTYTIHLGVCFSVHLKASATFSACHQISHLLFFCKINIILCDYEIFSIIFKVNNIIWQAPQNEINPECQVFPTDKINKSWLCCYKTHTHILL